MWEWMAEKKDGIKERGMRGRKGFTLIERLVATCPPEECYPGALTDGRSPIAASAEGANRGVRHSSGAFSDAGRRTAVPNRGAVRAWWE